MIVKKKVVICESKKKIRDKKRTQEMKNRKLKVKTDRKSKLAQREVLIKLAKGLK